MIPKEIPKGKPHIIRTPRVSLRWCLELLWNTSLHRINLRYKETLLGFGWIFLQPVALTMVFNYLHRVTSIPTGNHPYPLFVAIGLVPWSFTSLAVSQSSISVAGNQLLLKRVAVPKILFPLSAILSTMADLGVMTFLLIGLFFYYGFWPGLSILWVPLLFAVHLALLTGLACLLSLAHVFLRDVGQAVPHLLWLWFFGSPVFYPASMVPHDFRALALWNPMGGLLESYRAVLLFGKPPPLDFFLPAVLVSFGILITGVCVFQAAEGTLVDML